MEKMYCIIPNDKARIGYFEKNLFHLTNKFLLYIKSINKCNLLNEEQYKCHKCDKCDWIIQLESLNTHLFALNNLN